MKIVRFEEFAYVCPYSTAETEVNNGYGCNHPEQDETEEGQGKCYCWSCPLGSEAEAEDADDENVDLDGISKEELAGAEGNSEYLLINVENPTEDEEKALRAYEAWTNRYSIQGGA